MRILLAVIITMLSGAHVATAETVAITGGTVIDVSHFGKSENDIENAVILIRDGHFLSVGPASTVAIPKGAKRINLKGPRKSIEALDHIESVFLAGKLVDRDALLKFH